MSAPSETPIRVYSVGESIADPQPNHLGSADEFSLVDLLRALRKQGRITDSTHVGIMERPFDDQPGEWLVNPWA